MQAEVNQLGSLLAHLMKETGTVPGPTMNLGKGDGLGTLIVPNNADRLVYLHDPLTNQQDQAYLPPNNYVLYQDGDARVEGYVVRTGYLRGSKQLTVIDCDTAAGRRAVGDLSLMEEFIFKAYWAMLDQITTLRAAPTDPVTTELSVQGNLWYLDTSGVLTRFTTISSAVISDAIDALDGTSKHQLALLYLDKATHALALSTATAVTPSGSLPAKAEFSADVDGVAFTTDSSQIPIMFLNLYDGQTSVAETDLYREWGDPRPLFSGGGALGGEDTLNTVLTDDYGIILTDDNGRIITA